MKSTFQLRSPTRSQPQAFSLTFASRPRPCLPFQRNVITIKDQAMRTDPHFTTPIIIYADIIEIIIGLLASEAHPSWRPYTGTMRLLHDVSPIPHDAPDLSKEARSALLKCALICREWLRIARHHTFRHWTLSIQTYTGLSTIKFPCLSC